MILLINIYFSNYKITLFSKGGYRNLYVFSKSEQHSAYGISVEPVTNQPYQAHRSTNIHSSDMV